MIHQLPVVVPGPAGEPPPGLGADHPMRVVTRAAAFDPAGWTDERRREVTSLFDSLADEWSSRDVPGRAAPILDALDRGLTAAPHTQRRVALDVGAGDGLNTRHLTPTFPDLITLDLSGEMLRRSVALERSGRSACRVRADSSQLPMANASVDALVLANAFLFPDEVQRVLAPTGVVVWVNSRGTGTPIHLPATEVDEALPGDWDGVASSAGWGTWSVHWRAQPSVAMAK